MSAVIAGAKLAAEPYIIYAKLALLLAVAGTIGYQHWRIGDLEADAVLYKAATAGYADAQKVNLATVDQLQTALNDVVAINRMDEARASAAAVASSQRQQAIETKLATTTKELADVYAHNANARAWGNTGVDSAVLARMPNHAAADANEDRREVGSGAGAAAKVTGSH